MSARRAWLVCLKIVAGCVVLGVWLGWTLEPAFGQRNRGRNWDNWGGGWGNNWGLWGAVGGISINPDGILDNASPDVLQKLSKQRAEALKEVDADLATFTPNRKISLRQVEATLHEHITTGTPLPDAVMLLGGLQRIRYVFVYPELRDIVLVGPAEGWKTDHRGNIVGRTTKRPVMLLDDLVVALRSARQAAQGGIVCSIDPTPEGLARLQQHVNTLRTIGNPAQTAAGIEEALGPQRITLGGVPATSRFACVLVAADYRMKRIAMNFEPSPVQGLPSYLQMIPATGRGMSNLMPRWWLEPNYEPLLRDEAGLAWELRGASVKAMTEEDFVNAAGNRQHTGKANPIAQRWADLMTQKYPELAVAEPVFGELQNCMDLAIVAAIITKERLLERAGLSLPLLLESPEVRPVELPAPKTVASKASLLKKGNNWVISASGGIAINSWGIASRSQRSDAPAAARAKTAPEGKMTWWWD